MFFPRSKIIIIFVVVLTLIVALLLFINNPASNLIAAVLGSIVASMAVSAFYNEELHKAMDKYKRIGLKNYFENFEDAHDEIKDRISRASQVDIFVMYGDSFLNTSTKSIQTLLLKENAKFRYFMYNTTNPFIEAYGYHWGDQEGNTKYNKDGIKAKIESVKADLKRITSNRNINSVFELFQIESAPISYSFYRIDNELYFVPSKNIRVKEIKPAVFHFKKTELENSMFSKVETELNKMILNKEVIKIEI